VTRFVAAAFALSLSALALRAQAPASAGLAGRITADTMPVRGAVIRATLGSRTLEARSGEGGDFRITPMTVGIWVLSVRRFGYVPVVDTVVVGELGARREYRLTPVANVLDPVLVDSRWVGVRGIVVDARTQQPLAGARLQLSGARTAQVETDSTGRFAVERIPGSDVTMRARRAGYATRIVTALVPKDGYAQVEVALDTILRPRSEVMEGDLDSRLRWASPRSGIISDEDFQATDAKNLFAALFETPTVQRKGLAGDLASVSTPKCYLLDGFPLTRPVQTIRTNEVEFVEIYPAGTEYSGTLSLRFKSGVCAVHTRRVHSRSPVYVAIWTRGR
jgi:hypothetical protein